MYSRLKGKVVIRFMYVGLILYVKPLIVRDFIALRENIPGILKTGPSAIENIEPMIESMSKTLLLLCISMYLNYMFFVTRVTKYLILKKLSRSMEIINWASVVVVI